MSLNTFLGICLFCWIMKTGCENMASFVGRGDKKKGGQAIGGFLLNMLKK